VSTVAVVPLPLTPVPVQLYVVFHPFFVITSDGVAVTVSASPGYIDGALGAQANFTG
jgi:hypothetical protein